MFDIALCWQGEEQKEDEEFAIVFAAMGVNMETAHFFKQVQLPLAALIHAALPSYLYSTSLHCWCTL